MVGEYTVFFISTQFINTLRLKSPFFKQPVKHGLASDFPWIFHLFALLLIKSCENKHIVKHVSALKWSFL